MKTEVMLVTPSMAREFLAHVDEEHKNREIHDNVVSQYARDMANGNWLTTHQGIAFDERGYLRDGQHRLLAIIESNTPVLMQVTFGLPSCSYAGIDVGIKRSTKDVFALSDEIMEDVLYNTNAVYGMVRSLYKNSVSSKTTLSNAEIKKLITKFHPQISCVYRSAITKRGGTSVTKDISGAALSALIYGEQEKDIAEFFKCFKSSDISGSTNKNANAPLKWANRILSARAKHLTMSCDAIYRGTQNAIWNYCKNTSYGTMAKIAKTERYPIKDIVVSALK